MILGDIWTILRDCFLCSFYVYGYIRDLEEKVNTLSGKKVDLQAVYDGVNGRVQQARQDGYVPRPTVLHWLGDVQDADRNQRVDSLLQSGEDERAKLCLRGHCSWNCYSAYSVSSKVVRMTEVLQGLIETGNGFKDVADPPPPPVVEMLPKEITVGMESRLNEVWGYVQEYSVTIICLYGVRGVGKTTLLRNLNHKFSNAGHNFDRVILVESRTDVINIETIQLVLKYRLAIPNEVWDNKNQQGRAAEIFQRLSQRRFALLLDDLRGPINLAEAGVPVQNGSKIVYTTIMEDACNAMGDQMKFKVDCLLPDDAWNLFRLMVKDDVLNSHPDIPGLAETVAGLCGRLPLALITIGSAMASRRNRDAWENAVVELSNYPAEFPRMGDLIFPRLKFSYDHLSSETHKTCFLFCSLFLKNQLIRKDELVDLWIGEGFLRDSHKIALARMQGKSIIDSLICVCLLEEVQAYFGNYVKMHDMLRDLALWIAFQDEGNKILASKPENDKLIIERQSATWNEAVRVSLWSFLVTSLAPTPLSTPAPPSCPRLLTLLVRYTSMKEVPKGFFQLMPALRVLQWSRNGHLTKLPVEKGELINLRYLNLSDTDISQLPVEIKGCCQLIILLLDGTEKLTAIPKGLLSELSALQVFSRVPTDDYNDYESDEDKLSVFGVSVSSLHELESLKHIQDVSVVLSTLDSVQKFQSSSKLQSCIRRLIIETPESSSTSSITTMLHDGDFQNLQDLFISNCSMQYLTCLVKIPLLRFLFATNCPLLEEIIANHQAGQPIIGFTHLKQLNLNGLPELKSICGSAMAFPSLESIYVSQCQNLKKLPLNSQSGKRNTVLIGGEEWWNQLAWDDDATKDVFSSKFIPFSDFPNSNELEPCYTYEASVMKRYSIML
ncbi:putative disease resistance protein [Citrus sinensis]|uniref:Disease resistance protein n=1 Tax=Citrus sinensis TaxID=2711 RepID=A0ACB8JJS6_CITSI|nr:putative disease resistance protein [Citrus sinensis]